MKKEEGESDSGRRIRMSDSLSITTHFHPHRHSLISPREAVMPH